MVCGEWDHVRLRKSKKCLLVRVCWGGGEGGVRILQVESGGGERAACPSQPQLGASGSAQQQPITHLEVAGAGGSLHHEAPRRKLG